MVLLLAVLPMVLLLYRLVVLLLLLLAEDLQLTAVGPARRSLASTRQIWRALLPLTSRSNSALGLEIDILYAYDVVDHYLI